MNKSCYDILILGAGPVGLYAAALAHDKGLSVKIIEATNQIGGQVVNLFPNKLIHDFPSYQNILATELVNNLVATVQNANIKINTNEELIHFVKSDDGFECKTTNEEFLTKSIILAIGNGFFTPNKLEIIGANTDKVTYKVSSNLHDYDNKDIIILGGGDSAVDFANNIKTNSSANVTIIHRRDVFRANGENVNKLNKNNVNIILNAELKEIKDDKLLLVDKISHKENQVHFDTIIVQYGQKINTNLPSYLEEVSHMDFGKFVTDRNQQTNIDNIYAVGNCCFYPNRGNLISIGCGEAAVAVLDILRKLKKYEEHKIA